MAKETYSFLNIAGTLVSVGGTVTIGARSGIAQDGATIEYEGDKATMTPGADGAWMHSLHAFSGGSFTLRVLKTAPLNSILSKIYDATTSSSANYGGDTISVRDTVRGDSWTLEGCGIRKFPSTVYAKEGAAFEWVFNCGKITGLLGNGQPSL